MCGSSDELVKSSGNLNQLLELITEEKENRSQFLHESKNKSLESNAYSERPQYKQLTERKW